MGQVRFSLTILTMLLPILSIFADYPDARAPTHGCSNSTLRGSYGFRGTGTAPTGEPFASVGVFSFDGDGNLTGTVFTRRTGGITLGPLNLTGTYTVNSNCTVSDTWVFPNGAIATHESVILDKGKGYFLINTNATGDLSVISGEGLRQVRRDNEDREDDEDSR
jgi:hypothetical protein